MIHTYLSSIYGRVCRANRFTFLINLSQQTIHIRFISPCRYLRYSTIMHTLYRLMYCITYYWWILRIYSQVVGRFEEYISESWQTLDLHVNDWDLIRFFLTLSIAHTKYQIFYIFCLYSEILNSSPPCAVRTITNQLQYTIEIWCKNISAVIELSHLSTFLFAECVICR